MSFSAKVKAELNDCIGNARHCQLAELAAILALCGRKNEEDEFFWAQIENEALAKKCFTLLKKLYNIDKVDRYREYTIAGYSTYYQLFTEHAEEEKVLSSMKLLLPGGGVRAPGGPTDERLIRNACCKRAYLRGAFLCVGSISNPEKGYHMEFACGNEAQASQILGLIRDFGIEAKLIQRKKYHVVYIKEGEAIVDLLNIMGAYVSLMDLENTRILREIANSINRRVNCEAANISKTVNAANKQIEDILYIREHYGFDKLPVSLRQMAEVRLEYRDASLKELGELLEPPVGKSGVNHRLRKLSELADSLRL